MKKQSKPFYKSKKFWATVSGCAVVIGQQYLGLDEAATLQLIGLIGSYVLGQGMADIGKEINE